MTNIVKQLSAGGNLPTGWAGNWLAVWGIPFKPLCIKNGQIRLMTETIWDKDGGSGQAIADRVAKSSLLLPTRILRTDGGFDMSDDLNQDNWVFLPSDDEYLYFWYRGEHLYFMDADQTANTNYDSERIVGGVFHPETPLPDGDINHV